MLCFIPRFRVDVCATAEFLGRTNELNIVVFAGLGFKSIENDFLTRISKRILYGTFPVITFHLKHLGCVVGNRFPSSHVFIRVIRINRSLLFYADEPELAVSTAVLLLVVFNVRSVLHHVERRRVDNAYVAVDFGIGDEIWRGDFFGVVLIGVS